METTSGVRTQRTQRRRTQSVSSRSIYLRRRPRLYHFLAFCNLLLDSRTRTTLGRERKASNDDKQQGTEREMRATRAASRLKVILVHGALFVHASVDPPRRHDAARARPECEGLESVLLVGRIARRTIGPYSIVRWISSL